MGHGREGGEKEMVRVESCRVARDWVRWGGKEEGTERVVSFRRWAGRGERAYRFQERCR